MSIRDRVDGLGRISAPETPLEAIETARLCLSLALAQLEERPGSVSGIEEQIAELAVVEMLVLRIAVVAGQELEGNAARLTGRLGTLRETAMRRVDARDGSAVN